jgi:NADH dehydrogenase [ubiquinone] 1 alpha subcomplex assembly factor 1
MNTIISILLVVNSMNLQVIFDFNKNSDIQNFHIVDDVVMGGESLSNFNLNEDGFGDFKGIVSLENNGGFSSVRYRFDKIKISNFTKIILKLRGDGKRYQFRIKSDSNDYYSFISYFKTGTDWQEIEINLKDMYPVFRGRKLDLGYFSDEYIEEIAFLIGNKKEERFMLLIDKIYLK